VREHVAKLSAKAYWQQFDTAPDFVIMFLPGESFYRAALEQDPSLLELGGAERVVLASPATLITLLRTVAVGWREEKVAESARAVSELGRELYERIAVLGDHFARLGGKLDGAVQEYNRSVGSFERRVLVQARRFTDHGIRSGRELPTLTPIERSVQPPQTLELPPPAADAA
jgi:DNA recombination protein RmuC